MKKIILIFCLCTTSIYAQEVPMYKEITNNVPEVGEKKEVYLGDRMLIQRTGEWKECIVPKDSFKIPVFAGGAEMFLKANQPLCKKDADSELYEDKINSLLFKLTEKNNKYGLTPCILRTFNAKCFKSKTIKNLDKTNLEVSDRYFLYRENTFQQSIEYSGKNENNLKFIYSEFTDGFARQAFNREFQIDFSEGNVAAYKGAVIEIHQATNTKILYSVIRNFAD